MTKQIGTKRNYIEIPNLHEEILMDFAKRW